MKIDKIQLKDNISIKLIIVMFVASTAISVGLILFCGRDASYCPKIIENLLGYVLIIGLIALATYFLINRKRRLK
jgi:hypothetical protein